MKKLLAIVLALMVLALPVVSLAEGDFISEAVENGRMVERVTTVKIGETGDESVDQLLSELLNALSFVTYWQEAGGEQAGLRVNLSGTDILSVDIAGADDMAYLRSDLLKGDTVAIGANDVEPLGEKVVQTLVAMGVMDEETAQAALEQIKSSTEGVSNPMADVDFEAIMNGFDFTAQQAFVEELLAERIEQADLSGLPEGCDPASAAFTLKMTAEDIVKVYDNAFEVVKANKEYLALLDTMIVSVNDVPMSAEDAINEMQEQINTLLPESIEGEIPVTVYLNGDDEVVAATMTMSMKVPATEGGEPEPIKADVNYKRQTAEEMVMHTVEYTIANEQGIMALASLMVVTSEGYVDAMLSIQDEENTVVFGFQKTETVTDTERAVDAVVAVSFGTNEAGAANSASTVLLTVDIDAKKNGVDAEQTTVLKLNMNDSELVTVTTQSKTAEPKESIVTDDAIRLAELSQDDFQAWIQGVIVNLQVWAMTAIQALPSSLLMMLIGQ